MAKAKSAISLGVSALIVIALILIVGFGVFLNATFNATSTTNIGTSVSTIANSSSGSTVSSSPVNLTTNSTINNQDTTLGNSSTSPPASSYVAETYNYATMPENFMIGNYNFGMIYNGTDYVYSQNGTETANIGFNMMLNVTSPSGSWQTVDFGWAPPAPQPHSLPTPQNASLFDGAVQMNWYYNTTGISGTFLTISIPQILPSSPPAFLEGISSTENVSCLLSTGVCSLTMVYNGTDPLELESCQFAIVSSSSSGGTTITTTTLVNGTIGGQATTGIPANSQVSATCTMPNSELALQTKGSSASGGFGVKLVDSSSPFPAGTEAAGFGFEGTWSSNSSTSA